MHIRCFPLFRADDIPFSADILPFRAFVNLFGADTLHFRVFVRQFNVKHRSNVQTKHPKQKIRS